MQSPISTRRPRCITATRGVAGGHVDVRCEVEDLGKQNDAVEIHAFLVLENVGDHGGTGCAITLAKDEFGRIPAAIFSDETGDETGKGVGVLVDTPECLLGILAQEAAKAGARHIDKNQVAYVEQRVSVVDHFVGCGGQRSEEDTSELQSPMQL